MSATGQRVASASGDSIGAYRSRLVLVERSDGGLGERRGEGGGERESPGRGLVVPAPCSWTPGSTIRYVSTTGSTTRDASTGHRIAHA
eukprot:2532387-Rhodomonas_salina.1